MASLQQLQAMEPKHEFFIGIDSDGCCFDSMELKHKECFIPNIIKYWDCRQSASSRARRPNSSISTRSGRGVNRFPALLYTFDLLDEWPDVQARGWTSPSIPSLREWVATETKLGNPALEKAVANGGDEVLRRTLDWSNAVNQAVGTWCTICRRSRRWWRSSSAPTAWPT